MCCQKLPNFFLEMSGAEEASLTPQEMIEKGWSSIVDGLYCKASISSAGNPCLRVLNADVRMIGLESLQHHDVGAELQSLGYKGVLLPDQSGKERGAVNVPLIMAWRLRELGVSLVKEALEAASSEEYRLFLIREKKENIKKQKRIERERKKAERSGAGAKKRIKH